MQQVISRPRPQPFMFNPDFKQTMLDKLNGLDIQSIQRNIDNLKNREHMLLNSRNELQQLVDPMTVIAGVKAGTEAAGAVMDVVERGAKLVGDAIEWADKTTDEAADVERINAVLDFIR